MRPSKSILHHVLVRRAIMNELRSGAGDDIRSRFEVFQDTSPDADSVALVGMRTSRW